MGVRVTDLLVDLLADLPELAAMARQAERLAMDHRQPAVARLPKVSTAGRRVLMGGRAAVVMVLLVI